jgi:hypothetical protein
LRDDPSRGGVLGVLSGARGAERGDHVSEVVAGGALGDGRAPAVGVDLPDAGLEGVEAGRECAHAEVGRDERHERRVGLRCRHDQVGR